MFTTRASYQSIAATLSLLLIACGCDWVPARSNLMTRVSNHCSLQRQRFLAQNTGLRRSQHRRTFVGNLDPEAATKRTGSSTSSTTTGPVYRNRQGLLALVEFPPVQVSGSVPEVDASMLEPSNDTCRSQRKAPFYGESAWIEHYSRQTQTWSRSCEFSSVFGKFCRHLGNGRKKRIPLIGLNQD
jgi:hypothetical protein